MTITALAMAFLSLSGMALAQDVPYYMRETKKNQDIGAINRNFQEHTDRQNTNLTTVIGPSKCSNGGVLQGAAFNRGGTWGGACATLYNKNYVRPRKGILIPLYEYPSSINTNGDWNYVFSLAKSHHDVPTYIIMNPSNGPGASVDGNWTHAISRAQGAGIITLGYVADNYATRGAAAVQNDITSWTTMYAAIDGIFLDTVFNISNPSTITYYNNLTTFVHNDGLYPMVLNPGAMVDQAFSTGTAGDIFLTYENSVYPSTSQLAGSFFGDQSEYDYGQRAAIVHGQIYSSSNVAIMATYDGLIYVTTITTYGTVPPHLGALYDFISNFNTSGDTLTLNGISSSINPVQTMWLQSVDGATQSSGCVVTFQFTNNTGGPSDSLVFTSTTTSDVGPIGVLMTPTCSPGQLCQVAIHGPVWVPSITPGNCGIQNNIIISTTRCSASANSTAQPVQWGSCMGSGSSAWVWLP